MLDLSKVYIRIHTFIIKLNHNIMNINKSLMVLQGEPQYLLLQCFLVHVYLDLKFS